MSSFDFKRWAIGNTPRNDKERIESLQEVINIKNLHIDKLEKELEIYKGGMEGKYISGRQITKLAMVEKLAIEKLEELIIGLTFKDVIRGSKEFNKGFDLACDSIKEHIVNILKELKGEKLWV